MIANIGGAEQNALHCAAEIGALLAAAASWASGWDFASALESGAALMAL